MALIFGQTEPGIEYTERRAAYVVIFSDDGKVARVKAGHKYFLPGGCSGHGEAPEGTIHREVREELARSVRLIHPICAATQYFYSATDDRHYRLQAVFFRGELTGEPTGGTAEHETEWLPFEEAEDVCFHACHAWAVRQS